MSPKFQSQLSSRQVLRFRRIHSWFKNHVHNSCIQSLSFWTGIFPSWFRDNKLLVQHSVGSLTQTRPLCQLMIWTTLVQVLWTSSSFWKFSNASSWIPAIIQPLHYDRATQWSSSFQYCCIQGWTFILLVDYSYMKIHNVLHTALTMDSSKGQFSDSSRLICQVPLILSESGIFEPPISTPELSTFLRSCTDVPMNMESDLPGSNQVNSFRSQKPVTVVHWIQASLIQSPNSSVDGDAEKESDTSSCRHSYWWLRHMKRINHVLARWS